MDRTKDSLTSKLNHEQQCQPKRENHLDGIDDHIKNQGDLQGILKRCVL